MNLNFYLKYTLVLFALIFAATAVKAIGYVEVTPKTSEHIFRFGELEFVEDTTGNLTFEQVSSADFQTRFQKNTISFPVNENASSVYWYKINVRYEGHSDNDYLLEFYTQSLEDVTVFVPDKSGKYIKYQAGAKYDFNKRLFGHKNFEFWLPAVDHGLRTYYFSVKSSSATNIVVVHKTLNRFIQYALTEYLFFGLFYGTILVFSFYNLIMYLVIFERQYIYYIIYLIAVGLYELSTDGIAFQYLWPNSPVWNKYAFGTWLVLISTFALLFAINLLQLRVRARKLYYLITIVIGLRICYYLICVFYQNDWFNYSVIEMIPLTIAFCSGIYIWRKGYKPARFFVLAYTFLFLGFIVKLWASLGYAWFIPGPLPHYSMSIGFLGEMIFLSLAIGDKVRLLKVKKEKAQRKIIGHMYENARLKDSINSELEAKVAERTHVIIEKNKLLNEQAAEIARMNLLLAKDNEQLQTDIKKVTHHRLMSAEVSFEEFSKQYPDRETCFKFLSELKWADGYTCRKCGNTSYWAGNLPFSRKCSKCKYDESVIIGTVLQNTRIPVNKALYIIFLVYSTKGKISSHKLSEVINIRQNTCLIYSSKIKKLMAERRKELQNTGEKGWSKLLIE